MMMCQLRILHLKLFSNSDDLGNWISLLENFRFVSTSSSYLYNFLLTKIKLRNAIRTSIREKNQLEIGSNFLDQN
jgi:hypothetical protein